MSFSSHPSLVCELKSIPIGPLNRGWALQHSVFPASLFFVPIFAHLGNCLLLQICTLTTFSKNFVQKMLNSKRFWNRDKLSCSIHWCPFTSTPLPCLTPITYVASSHRPLGQVYLENIINTGEPGNHHHQIQNSDTCIIGCILLKARLKTFMEGSHNE